MLSLPKGWDQGRFVDRVLLSALVGAALSIGVAHATDLGGMPAFQAPITAPAYNWTGWYVSSSPDAGASRGSPAGSFAGVPAGGTSGPLSGIIGGIQSGYSLQNDNWIFGLETDMQGFGAAGSQVPPGSQGYSSTLPWFGTVRGRVGLTPASGWLFYATGGLAYGDFNAAGPATAFTAAGAAPIPYTFTDSKLGWTLGVGVEGALPSNWTWKLEYLYLKPDDAGHANSVTGFTFTTGHDYDNLVRAGLNYRFGWDGPVIGK